MISFGIRPSSIKCFSFLRIVFDAREYVNHVEIKLLMKTKTKTLLNRSIKPLLFEENVLWDDKHQTYTTSFKDSLRIIRDDKMKKISQTATQFSGEISSCSADLW